jgi:hypothetical protein
MMPDGENVRVHSARNAVSNREIADALTFKCRIIETQNFRHRSFCFDRNLAKINIIKTPDKIVIKTKITILSGVFLQIKINLSITLHQKNRPNRCRRSFRRNHRFRRFAAVRHCRRCRLNLASWCNRVRPDAADARRLWLNVCLVPAIDFAGNRLGFPDYLPLFSYSLFFFRRSFVRTACN